MSEKNIKDLVDSLPSKYLRMFIRKIEERLYDEDWTLNKMDYMDYRKLLRETGEEHYDYLKKKIKKREIKNER